MQAALVRGLQTEPDVIQFDAMTAAAGPGPAAAGLADTGGIDPRTTHAKAGGFEALLRQLGGASDDDADVALPASPDAPAKKTVRGAMRTPPILIGPASITATDLEAPGAHAPARRHRGGRQDAGDKTQAHPSPDPQAPMIVAPVAVPVQTLAQPVPQAPGADVAPSADAAHEKQTAAEPQTIQKMASRSGADTFRLLAPAARAEAPEKTQTADMPHDSAQESSADRTALVPSTPDVQSLMAESVPTRDTDVQRPASSQHAEAERPSTASALAKRLAALGPTANASPTSIARAEAPSPHAEGAVTVESRTMARAYAFAHAAVASLDRGSRAAGSGTDQQKPTPAVTTPPVSEVSAAPHGNSSPGFSGSRSDASPDHPAPMRVAAPAPTVSAAFAAAVDLARAASSASTAAVAIANEATAPPPPAMLDEQLPKQIVQAMRLQLTDTTSNAHLRLQPDFLGDLSISITVEHGGVTATVDASAPAVREWIAAHEPMLRQALSDQGLHLERLIVADEPQQSDGQPEQRRQDQERPSKDDQRRARQSEDATFEVLV